MLAPLSDADPKRILLIAPTNSYRIAPFFHAADELGVDLLVASTGTYSIVSAAVGGLQIPPNHDDALSAILQEASLRPFNAVIGTDDVTVELACCAAHLLGLPHNPLTSIRYSRRKDLARERLRHSGLLTPNFRRIDLTTPVPDQIVGLDYPCVIKPLALSASRGVIRANSPNELMTAASRVHQIIRAERQSSWNERNCVLVEDYIPGIEIALEGVLTSGQLTVLAIFDKPDPLHGPYFEETYYITPSRLDKIQQQQITSTIAAACSCYGLQEGPVHAELRINKAGIWCLEVAARSIGGQCARILQIGTGLSLEAIIMEHALGKYARQQHCSGAGVLMIPVPTAGVLRRIEGLLAAQKIQYIEAIEISVRDGYELVPVPEGSSYLGFIFAVAPSPELAETALRKAHACLRIIIAPVWKIQTGA